MPEKCLAVMNGRFGQRVTVFLIEVGVELGELFVDFIGDLNDG